MDIQEYRTAKAKLNNIADRISDKEANKLIDLALKVKKYEEIMLAPIKINILAIALYILIVLILFIIILILI
jgi:hypothetical protein